MTAATPVTQRGWCTFEVSGRDYAVDVASVQEVLRAQPLTRVPGAPPAWTGLLNLRGRIVPAVDLRVLFGRAPVRGAAAAGPGGALVVVRTPEGPLALGVDAIGDVRRGGDCPLQPWPAANGERGGPEAALFAGVLVAAERLVAVLDLERVVERAFARTAQRSRTAGDPS